VFHPFAVTRSPVLDYVYSPGLADNGEYDNINEKIVIRYVHRSHADIAQTGNHEIVDEGDHAHDKLLHHNGQGNSQRFSVK